MAKFMFLLRSTPGAQQPRSAEQMEQSMKKYMAWKERLEQGGHLIDFGAPLAGSGKVLGEQGKVVSDGPYVEVKDFIQGYMFIEAEDLEQAAALAAEGPILEGGGTLEIRPVVSMRG
ncbi:MAG: YciI family protein [Caldilineaceae bacterium]